MAEKKFFVDINLQGNKLMNPVVGSNSSMTAEGSFQYNAGRLEYYNGSTVQEVANLNDIAAVTGGLILQGGYDADTNTPDIADGSALKGYFWVVTVAGLFLGESVQVGDSIIAKIDEAGAILSDWLILQGNVVIATDSVDGISRLATQTEANDGTEGGAVVITPATLQGKIDAQITPEINSKVSKSGDTMSGSLDMGGNDLNNVQYVNATGVATDQLISTTTPNIALGSNLDADNAQTIINLPAPTNGGDAANKTYVDDNTSNKLPLAGGTMSGNIDLGGNNIDGVNEITATYAYINALTLKLSAQFGIGDLPTPTVGTDATNKDYVDNAASTAQSNAESFATSAANTAESNANAYTDTAIAAQSYRVELASGDWTLNGSTYEATVTHNLNSSYPVVTFTDSNEDTVELIYTPQSANSLVVKSNILPTVIGVSLVAVR